MQELATAPATYSKKALIADDDAFYREMASSSLAAAGYSTVLAADGTEALHLLLQQSFELAILDVTMPGIDGFEVTRRARTMNLTLPIIVVTGQDDTKSVETAFKVGATSFIAKPVNWPLFVQQVNFVYRAAQTEADLRDAKRTAEFLSDLKGRVLSVLVSEFETPLRTATSLVELLRKEPHGPLGNRTYLEYANDARASLNELKSVQLKMMNTGRVLAEGLTLHEERLSLKALVLEAIEAVRVKADRRRIVIDARVSIKDDLEIRCDRALISQALKSLMESAITLSPRHSAITVDARLEPDQGFVFAVGDSGPALPEKVVCEILAAPAQNKNDDTAMAVTRNTGLTMSRVLAEAHQGNLAIRSTQGEGTVAKLLLPSSRLVTPTSGAGVNAAHSPGGTPGRRPALWPAGGIGTSMPAPALQRRPLGKR